MAFQFPDPTSNPEVINPITGSKYGWIDPPGKWILVDQSLQKSEIIWEGDNPPDPIGDYKLWYSTDTLELYFYYCDANSACAWVPTSVPITALADVKAELEATGAMVATVDRLTEANYQEIYNLALRVKELEDTAVKQEKEVFKGPWIKTSDETPTNGFWNFEEDEGTWNTEDDIYLGLEDTQGVVHIYGDADQGDILTIKEDDDNFGIYAIKKVKEEDSNGINYIEIRIDSVLNYKGEPHTGAEATVDIVSPYQTEIIDLETVLRNGNVADKSIVLTNLENDAILVSPEEARIMVGGVGENVVPRLELRHQTGILETSIVKLELDEDGKRFDIECDEKVDNIHFRFANDDKLVLNKKGDAAFTGKVQVEPGIEGNEAVTYNQLILLEEQIEELAPSFERGRWEFTPEYPPGFGEYTMIKEGLDEDAQEELCTQAFAECQLANQDDPVALADCTRDFNTCMDSINGTKYLTTEHWFESIRIVFSSKDKNGVTHRWNDIAPGLYIEVFNIDGTGGMVSEITKKNYQGDIFHMADRGIGQANGLAAVKIFTLNTSENLELQPTPAPFTWIFKKTSSLPGSGEMTCSTEAPAQGSFIKLSHTTSNNIQFSRRKSMQYFSSPQNLPLITIWDKVDAGYRHKLSASVSKIEQDAEGNFVIKLGSINSADNHNITAGATQWVTVGGFF